MITELLLDFFFFLVDLVIDLIPSSEPPGWLDNASGYFATIWAEAAGLGAWVPWGLFGTVLAAVLACIGLGFLIKVVRIVASFFTAGGGSAA